MSESTEHTAGRVATWHAQVMVRRRWIVLGAWFLILAAIVATGIPSFGRDGLSLEDLASPDSPEVQAELDSLRLFHIPLNAREQVVRRDAEGLSASVRRADAAASIIGTKNTHRNDDADDRILLQLPFTNTGGVFPASSEDSTTTINNLFGNPKRSLRAQVNAGQELADAAKARGGGDVNLTGGIPAQARMGKVVRDALGPLQVWSIILLVLITLIWFRALAPSLVVIVTIAATMLLMLEALSFLTTHLGVGVPAEVLPVVLVVAIGVASDYALFHIAAWSRLVKEGVSAKDASIQAITMNSSVVLTAGVTTSLGAMSLLLADTAFVKAFAPALIASIGVAIIVGLFLVPALISAFGEKLIWPRKVTQETSNKEGMLTRFSVYVTRPKQALMIIVVTVLVLVAIGLNVRSSPLGFNVITALPDDDPIVLGARDAGKGFAPGILSPTLLLIDGKDLQNKTDELATFTHKVNKLKEVAGVIGVDTLRSSLQESGVTAEQVEDIGVEVAGINVQRGRVAKRLAKRAANTDSVRKITDDMLVTSDGKHARLVLVLNHEAYTGRAAKDLSLLRPKLRTALDDAGLKDTKLRVAGDTALVDRISIQMGADLLRIAAFLIPLELFIMFLSLRSITMSVVIIGSGLLTTVAALGGLSIYDRTLGAGDGIAFFVPISAFVLLLSIGLDYGVLTGSTLRRLRSEGYSGLSLARLTIEKSYASVVLAGVVIASTFALLAMVNLDSFRQIAIVMCIGIFLDALIVRPIIVPLVLGLLDKEDKQVGLNKN